jgi:hypothetical protein
MTDVSVIIVNWNTPAYLKACLSSLYAEPRPQVSYDVWVVDNASIDNSVAMVKSEFPQVNVIENTENLGFSKANNKAIRASTGRYVFLLNSDASVHPGALDTLIEYADSHPGPGVMGPKVLNPDGSLQYSCRSFPNLWAGFFRNTKLGRLFPNNKHLKQYMLADLDHNKVSIVGWLSGCAMLIRRSLIDKVGPLDESFFMYCEDVDMCKRSWDAECPVTYVPMATVTHAIGKSSDKSYERATALLCDSWRIYYIKHFGHRGKLRVLAVTFGLWAYKTYRIQKRRLMAKRMNAAT